MVEKMNTRKKQALNTKMRIYNKTLELLKERDYQDLTIQEICKNADVSVGNFYNYFSSKEELLIQAYPYFDDYVKEECTIDEDTQPVKSIIYIILAQAGVIDDLGPNISSQVLRVHLYEHGKYLIDPARPFHQYLLKLVDLAKEKGIWKREIESEKIASTILRISRGDIFDWAIRGGPYPIKEYILEDLENYFKNLSPEEY